MPKDNSQTRGGYRPQFDQVLGSSSTFLARRSSHLNSVTLYHGKNSNQQMKMNEVGLQIT